MPKWFIWCVLLGVVAIYCYLFYANFVKPYSFRWRALYGETDYPEAEVTGMDISHYQKTIQWDKVRKWYYKNRNISFVFVKATEGESDVDSCFNKNFQQAENQKFKRGAYHFFVRQLSGLNQARHFCKTVNLKKGDLPPVLDIEIDKEFMTFNNISHIKQEILNWLFYTENYFRVKPIIYASYNFRNIYLNDSIFNQYPYWIAHYYVDSLTYDGRWTFWQHTDAGHVDGIDGFVDLDIFNGNYNDLNNLCLK